MLEIFSSLYNRLFGSSASEQLSDETQQTNTPPRKGFFSGWNITFLFGPSTSENRPNSPSGSSTPQPSLLQRFFPFFFSTSPAADQQSRDASQKPCFLTVLNPSLISQSTESRGSFTKSKEIDDQRPSIQTAVGDQSVWIDRPSLEASQNSLSAETISLYSDPSDESTKIEIQKNGQKKTIDVQTLNLITEDLDATNSQYKTKPASYLNSFDLDANRGFVYTLEKTDLSHSYATNRETEHSPDNSNDPKTNPKVVQAHEVTKATALEIFPEDIQSQKTLQKNLEGISHQALFASPILAFSKQPPSDGTCLIQGAPSDADFSYSITGKREITIKATNFYKNANDNSLLCAVKNDEDQLEAKPLGFPKDGNNNSTGEITGSVCLTVIATIGDDGTITELRCTSMETSWTARLK